MPKAGGGMWSLLVQDSSNLKISFFEPRVLFLPLLPSTKLACRHFWKWFLLVCPQLSPKAGKLLYRLEGFNKIWKCGLGRMIEDRRHKLSDREDICTQRIFPWRLRWFQWYRPTCSELSCCHTGEELLTWPCFCGSGLLSSGSTAVPPTSTLCLSEERAQRHNVICQNLPSFCDDMRNLCIFGFSSRTVTGAHAQPAADAALWGFKSL